MSIASAVHNKGSQQNSLHVRCCHHIKYSFSFVSDTVIPSNSCSALCHILCHPIKHSFGFLSDILCHPIKHLFSLMSDTMSSCQTFIQLHFRCCHLIKHSFSFMSDTMLSHQAFILLNVRYYVITSNIHLASCHMQCHPIKHLFRSFNTLTELTSYFHIHFSEFSMVVLKVMVRVDKPHFTTCPERSSWRPW